MTIDRFILLAVSALAGTLLGLNIFGPSRDRLAYEIFFWETASQSVTDIFSRRDPFFFLVMSFFSYMDLSFSLFMVCLSIITIYLTLLSAVKSATWLPMFIALWCSHTLWLHTYTQVRIALSLALALSAIYIIRRRKYILFGLAFLSHSSILSVISVQFLSQVNYFKRYLIGPLSIAALVGFSAISLTISISVIQWLSPVSAAALQTYITLAGEGQLRSVNMLAVMPMVQLSCTIYISTFWKEALERHTGEISIAILGVSIYYLFSHVPVLAIRGYEMTIPFFLLLLARYAKHSYILLIIAFGYMAVGVRGVFWGSYPIIGM